MPEEIKNLLNNEMQGSEKISLCKLNIVCEQTFI